MNRLENLIASLDFILNSKRKRHIMGGVLMSASLLFAGLAYTALSVKEQKEEEENKDYDEYGIE